MFGNLTTVLSRWLFIVEFGVTMVIGGIGLMILPKTPEDAWFLNEEEKDTMRLRKQRDEAFYDNNKS
ncbi:hypothetical protein Sste5344_010076 [Sporothrix stenoceras]